MIETPRAVEPEDAIRLLSDVHPHVFQAIELGIESGRMLFDEHPFDPYMFSMSVRYTVWEELTKRFEGTAVKVQKLANLGLVLHCGEISCRIWKATDDGLLPPPGPSKARRRFYEQQLPLFGEEERLLSPVRLAFLWDADASGMLTEITLVCPSGAADEWRPGQTHWQIPIPEPATGVLPSPAFFELEYEHDLKLERLPAEAMGDDSA